MTNAESERNRIRQAEPFRGPRAVVQVDHASIKETIHAPIPDSHPPDPVPSAHHSRRSCSALAVAAPFGPTGASAGRAPDGGHDPGQAKNVAKKAANSGLGETILTNLKGRTLYSLSVEKKGKFICIGPCLSTWHPLVVPSCATPLGPVTLGT